LTGLVSDLDTTASALSSGDGALGRTVEALDRLLRVAPGALTEVDATLPSLVRFARALQPGLRGAPRTLAQISRAVAELAAVVTPRERARVLKALSITFDSLPTLVNRLAGLFPVTKPLTECLSTHVTPILTAKVPDGALSTNRPVWQDFAHTLVGLSSLSQNFDANGYNVRYDAGLGLAGFSSQAIPGLGQILSSAPPLLQSRPIWLGRGVKPAFRPDAPCADQPVPSLESKTRTVRTTRVARSSSPPPRVSVGGLKRLLDPARLRKIVERGR
jgi:hypothetical protein